MSDILRNAAVGAAADEYVERAVARIAEDVRRDGGLYTGQLRNELRMAYERGALWALDEVAPRPPNAEHPRSAFCVLCDRDPEDCECP